MTFTLQQLGLSEKESKVYLVLLEMGSSIASTLARRSNLNRSSVYEIIAGLKAKGIATEFIKDGIKYFGAVPPDVLLNKYEQKCENLRSTLPSFLAIMGKWGNRPKVEYYEGVEGLKRVFETVLNSGYDMEDPFLSFLGTNIDMDPRISEYLTKEFLPIRSKCPTKTKVIASKKNESSYLEFNVNTHEAMIIDDDVFEMGNEIVIFGGNKVAVFMYSKDELSGLIIESKTLHDGLKSVFNLIWKKERGTV